MPKKLFSKTNQPIKKRGPTKPKPLIAKLIDSFGGSISEPALVQLAQDAIKHAMGDVIVTESADGQKLEAKCISDPRLLLGYSKIIVDAELKSREPGALPPVLAALRDELAGYKGVGD